MLRKIKSYIIQFIEIQVIIIRVTFEVIFYILFGALSGLIVGSIVALAIVIIFGITNYLFFQGNFNREHFVNIISSTLVVAVILGCTIGSVYALLNIKTI